MKHLLLSFLALLLLNSAFAQHSPIRHVPLPPPVKVSRPWPQVSNALVVLEADSGVTTINGAVEAWQDSSPYANNFTQSVNANFPLFNASDINGHPSIGIQTGASTSGQPAYLTAPDFAAIHGVTSFSFAIVMKTNAVSTYHWDSIFWKGVLNSPEALYMGLNRSGQFYDNYSSSTLPGNFTPLNDGQPHLVEFIYNAPQQTIHIYVDGLLAGVSTGITLPAMDTVNPITVGYSYATQQPYTLNVSALALLGEDYSLNGDQAAIRNYLATKYGITLGTPATTYTLLAPSPANGNASVASGNFTVQITSGQIAMPVDITPYVEDGPSGIFFPQIIELTPGNLSGTFVEVPTVQSEPQTVSTTNDAGLDDPAGVLFTVNGNFPMETLVGIWEASSIQGATDGDAIPNRLPDTSGNGADFVNDGQGSLPAYIANGPGGTPWLNCLHGPPWAPGDMLMKCPSYGALVNTTSLTYMTVLAWTNPAALWPFFYKAVNHGDLVDGAALQIFINSGGIENAYGPQAGPNNGRIITSQLTYADGNPHLFVYRYNAATQTLELFADGQLSAQLTGVTVPPIDATNELYFGPVSADPPYTMHVGAHLLFGNALSDADLAIFSSYLANKYGVTTFTPMQKR